MLTPFGQLGQTDRPSLVGVQQALVRACGPVQSSAQLLFGGLLSCGAGVGGGGEMLELGQELVRIGKQIDDVVPHHRFDLVSIDVAAGADGGSPTQDAIFAVASVDLPH